MSLFAAPYGSFWTYSVQTTVTPVEVSWTSGSSRSSVLERIGVEVPLSIEYRRTS
ncbi:hypothetical protein DSECCO2_486920 [anaerobic digester metagenome]